MAKETSRQREQLIRIKARLEEWRKARQEAEAQDKLRRQAEGQAWRASVEGKAWRASRRLVFQMINAGYERLVTKAGGQPIEVAGQLQHARQKCRKLVNQIDGWEARQAKEQALRRERELGMQLIDAGYKALATKLHPDKKGGSQEAMMYLSLVRDFYKNEFR